jgi:hypothetical protein
MHADQAQRYLFNSLQSAAKAVHVIPDALYYPIIHQLEGVRRGEVFYDVRQLADQTMPERNVIKHLQSYVRSIA